jgi:hypothetical protein
MDSIKFYPRFNWIYGGFWWQENWFFKVNLGFYWKKLKIWGPIIILKSWFGQIRGLIETIQKKDQTGKGTKLNGSNYNLSGGLDYKIAKNFNNQIRSIIWVLKRRRFHEHYWLSPSEAVLAVKAEIRFFQQMR